MSNNVFIALRAQFRTRMNEVTDDMVNGICADFPAYTRMVGEIEGLARAERMLLDVEAAIRRKDGDDEEDA